MSDDSDSGLKIPRLCTAENYAAWSQGVLAKVLTKGMDDVLNFTSETCPGTPSPSPPSFSSDEQKSKFNVTNKNYLVS